eukprot:Plantae.Rhodophyta-Purpureofilum_apyrenoidigerum.ctg22480.p1 GENE.Plantae.Rhodophyta-Purpureofilum_apyrenoidigerum.ctg22480~~Plantae.Rhodophyta-Purpureofilum_apyrenoidigerum.ctg22480.p1  ORF type:complete len:324 (+),score=49.51 Plantae.Rhodophyta-Purpureofilum_apyrenoidigerum.ctg22480:101-1072(+)
MLRSDKDSPGNSRRDSGFDFVVSSETNTGEVLGGAASSKKGFVEFVGRVRVTVIGEYEDRDRLAVIALHDIGSNASTCFGSFFEHCRDLDVHAFTGSVQYFVDVAGHEENAATLPSTDPWYSLEDLVEEIDKVVHRFQLKRFLGLGVGAGSRILIDYAMRYPKAVKGLILVAPVVHASGFGEWLYYSTSVRYASFSGWSEQLKQRLLARWLSPAMMEEEESEVKTKYYLALDRLNPFNIARYLYAYATRKDLSPRLDGFRKRVLIIIGTESQLYDDSLRAFSSFDPATTTMVELRGGGTLCLDTDKDKCTEAIKLFLNSFGAI